MRELATVGAVQPRPWSEHLPPGAGLSVQALTARRSLPAAWGAAWAARPSAPLLREGAVPEAGWLTAGAFDEMTRRLALRLGRLGLGGGDRVLWSAASSVAAIAANVAALRAGLVVIPVNPQYTERELAHIVGDVRPAAAMVDDAGRGRSSPT